MRLWDAAGRAAKGAKRRREGDDEGGEEEENGRARPGGATLLRGHSAAVYGVDVSLDGQLLLSASGDGTLRLWSTELAANLVAYRCARPHSPCLQPCVHLFSALLCCLEQCPAEGYVWAGSRRPARLLCGLGTCSGGRWVSW